MLPGKYLSIAAAVAGEWTPGSYTLSVDGFWVLNIVGNINSLSFSTSDSITSPPFVYSVFAQQLEPILLIFNYIFIIL